MRIFKAFILVLLRGPVLFYRFALSPLIGPRCRYYPTCSAYMDEALHRHGPARGLWLGVMRILSCHPWARRPFCDPVPERFDWRDLFRYKRL